MATDTIDIEKGIMSATTRPMISSWASSAQDTANINQTTSHTPLELFQLLIGIHTPSNLTQNGHDRNRSAEAKSIRGRTDNVGLYQLAKQQERASRLAYLATSFISNTLYMLQIMLAAIFTAMSAYKDTHPVTLTALGAVNTVLAGCLAWQKGQGVPQRYRKAQDEYQALILEIEMAERSFVDVQNNDAASGAGPDPRSEKERLQKLFDAARANQQANYPDLYVSTGANAAKDLTKDLENAKAEAAKVQAEMLARIESLVGQLASKVDAHVEGAIQSVGKA